MRIPRLLVVADGDGELPLPIDCLEDWVTAGRARVGGRRPAARPRRCAPGSTRSGRCSTTTACCITATRGCRCRRSSSRSRGVLLDRFGAVVTREMLADRAWPAGVPTRNALDVHVLRLRRRIAPVGSRDPHGPLARLPHAIARGRARSRDRSDASRVASARATRDRQRRDVHRCRRRRRPRREGRVDARRSGPRGRARDRRGRRRRPGRRARARHDRRDERAARTARARASRSSRPTASPTRSRSRARCGPSLYDPFVDRPRAARAARAAVRGRRAGSTRTVARSSRSTARCPTIPDDVDAVAVCLLHADLDPAHERAVAGALRARGRELRRVLARGEPRVPRVRAHGDDGRRGVPRTGVRAVPAARSRRSRPRRS